MTMKPTPLALAIGGQQVGIIGIDIANKTQNSSSPLGTTTFLNEAETAQKMIDELEAAGINKIILLTHYQYGNDLALAESLSGVDVIIGGDSHTLLGDFDSYGLSASGPYPTQVKNADGDNACVAQAWQYAQVVGELKVSWDANGVIESCSGTPHLLLGDEIVRKEASGAEYTPEADELAEIMAAIDADPQLSLVEEDATAAQLLAYYTSQLDTFRNEIVGTASEDLCLERIPGQDRSEPPSCAGIMTRSAGERLYNLQVKPLDESAWRNLTDTETLNVVTNSFTGGGQDGYITFGTVTDDGRSVDTFLDYAQSFVDYVKAQGTLSKPALDEYSTQSYTEAPAQ